LSNDQRLWKVPVGCAPAADRMEGMKLDSSHLCTFYQTEKQRSTSLNAFVLQALKHQEKLILIADPLNAKANLIHLERVGIDLQPYVAEGQLRVLTVHQTFLRQGAFDPSKMIAWLQNETCRARAEGYRALRIAAEMTWVLLGATSSERLIDYETGLNEALHGGECRVLCQYDGQRFFPAVLQQVLAAHPTVLVGADIYPNPYYQLSQVPFGEGPTNTAPGHWLANLSAHNQAMFV
jgi:hypothetical protein